MWIYKKDSKMKLFKERVAKLSPVFFHLSRISLGLLFVFSGFVKAIDPLGSTYKFEDYFSAFGGFFNSLSFIALPAAIFLSTLELIIGLNLLLMIQLRRSSWFAAAFMLFMTPLTLYVALFNPVTDCGCFGDAWVLTNWQTFYKNIIFSFLVIVLICTLDKKKRIFLPKVEWLAIAAFVLTVVGLSLYCLRHEAPLDFRPYKIGVNIPEAMLVPEDAATDVYNTTFIYEKNGVQKEFTLENYPKDDSTWKFVDQKTVMVSQGYKAPIHDFSIVDANFEDITEQVIYNQGETYLLIMYDVNKASEEGAKRAETLYQKYKNSTTKFYALTASGDDEVNAFVAKTGVTYPFCKTDPITLKTIIRSNPGLMLIKNGTITGKWHWRDF